MQLYKKMIRPMVNPPVLQGFSDKPYPLFSDDYWVDGDYEETLTDTWKELVKKKDSWGSLEIEEKYVEVELPTPKPINVRDNNFICFMVDTNKIDIDIVSEYVKKYAEVLPKEVGIAILPSIEVKVLDKDTVDVFIDNYKCRVEEKYNKGEQNE